MKICNKISLLIFLFFATHALCSGQPFQQTWLQYYGEDSSAAGLTAKLIAADSNSVYVAATMDSVALRQIMLVVKYDMSGNVIWQKYYSNTQGYIYLFGIDIDSNGNLIIGAIEFTSWNNLEDYVIFKYDPSGNLLWRYAYNGLTSLTDWLYSIKVDNHNNIYAFGISQLENINVNNYQDAVTIKIGPAGNLLWQKYYSYPNDSLVHNYANDFEIDNAGNLIQSGNFADSIVCKLDSAGNTIWSSNFSGAYDLRFPIAIDDSCNYYFADGGGDNNTIVKIDSSGNIVYGKKYYPLDPYFIRSIKITSNHLYAAGWSGNISSSKCLVIKTDLNGDTVWTASFGPGNLDYKGVSIIPQTNGNVIVVCQVDSSSAHKSVIILKYSTLGQLLSQHVLSTSINFNNGWLSVANNEEGEVFCALNCIDSSNTYGTYGVAAYDTSGSLSWSDIRRNFQNDGADVGYKIIRRSSGDIIVAGRSQGPNYSETIVVLAYNPSGALLWKRRLQGPMPFSLPLHIISDDQDNINISGYQRDDNSSARHLFFAKLDASGNVRFIHTNNPQSNAYMGTSSFTDNSGNNFVGAISEDSAGYAMAVLIKYDSIGNFLWEKIIADSSNLTGLIYTGQDFFYEYGLYIGNASHSGDMTLIKSDTAGNILWRRDFDGVLSGNDSPIGCLLDAGGNIILAGITDATSGGGIIIQKYDPSGNPIWQTGLPQGTPICSPKDFTLDSAGNIYIELEQGPFYVTAMMDSAGNNKWIQNYSAPGSLNLNEPTAIAYDNGNVFVTGRIYSNGWLINLLVYDTTGLLIYQDTISSDSDVDDLNIGNDIVADGDGCVYITGLLDTYSHRQEIATMKYCSLTAGVTEKPKPGYVMNIFPNPNLGDFTITFISDLNSSADIEVFDIAGKCVSIHNVDVIPGLNSLELKSNVISPGYYRVALKIDGGDVKYSMFVKY